MSRNPIDPLAPRRVDPPADLTMSERSMWQAEFGDVPVGHFVAADTPVMRDHVGLMFELREAHRVMIAKQRSRDACAHWRGVLAAVMASRRALRMLPNTRQGPRRVGMLAAGPADYAQEGGSDWRALFPAQANITPIPRRAARRSKRRRP